MQGDRRREWGEKEEMRGETPVNDVGKDERTEEALPLTEGQRLSQFS